jgi:hypothetical protein
LPMQALMEMVDGWNKIKLAYFGVNSGNVEPQSSNHKSEILRQVKGRHFTYHMHGSFMTRYGLALTSA